MSNQPLIDFENQQQQTNLDNIAFFQWQMKSIDQAIMQANLTIQDYNNQHASLQSQIDILQSNNVLINQIIAILSS